MAKEELLRWMGRPSLLGSEEEVPPEVPPPPCFQDLLLDELEGLFLASQDGFGLLSFFRNLPNHKTAVLHRQAVCRELEGKASSLRGFLRSMEEVRGRLGLSQKARHPWQKALYHLQAARAYLAGVGALGRDWSLLPPHSPGLRAYAAHLEAYLQSPGFSNLRREAETVWQDLQGLRYVLHVHEGRLTLRAYQGEGDYGRRIMDTFRPFFGPSSPTFPEPGMEEGPILNHIEEWLLDHLALLFPGPFARLQSFFATHQGFLDPVLARLEREVRFFLAYLDFLSPLRAAGLPFTYPEPADTPPFFVEGAFDLVLAAKLVAEGKVPIPNDFRVEREHILVITGPNQGGKTTFARMVGQVHHLFSLGLPVPGRRARLLLPDQILSHFEVRENPEDLRSKLESDLLRLRDILEQATARSLLILNEPLASATLVDARMIGRFLLEKIRDKGSLALVVTFLDELARLPGTRSLVAEVDPSDPSRRTFHIREKPAEGKAYALALAARHGLTDEALKRRLGGGA